VIDQQTTGVGLKPNHANALPRYVVAIHTDGMRYPDADYHSRTMTRFRLGSAVSCRYQRDKVQCRKSVAFADPAVFWQWLYEHSRPNYTTWLVGHNVLYHLRQLDFMAEMVQGRITLDAPRKKRKSAGNPEDDAWGQGLCCIDAPPTIVGLRCSETQGRIICVDLLNWFDTSMARIALQLGIDLPNEPATLDNASKWEAYCQGNASAVLNAFVQLMQFNKDNSFGMFRYTAAAQAMSAYRHRFMPCRIYLHDNAQVKAIERTAYRGGRLECFRLGPIATDTYKLDVNSLFPSIMRDEPVPYILKRYELSERYRTTLPDIRWADSVASVAIHTNESVYPVLRNGEVVYPKGCFQTVLCGQELKRAFDRRQILAVASWAEYDCAILFRDFVDELWAMRQRYKSAGSVLYEAFTKRIMNALYGKFGQRAMRWETVHGLHAPDPFTTWNRIDATTGSSVLYRSFGWSVQRQSQPAEIATSFPAISAFITSAARCRMNALRKIAGNLDVYYQGIDSLLVSEMGRSRLLAAGEIIECELGKLRVEGASNYGHIYGVADYQLGDTIVIAGRSGRYETIADAMFLQRKTQGMADLFKPGLSPDIAENETFWQRRKRYAKGVVRTDGWVEPFYVTEPFDDGTAGPSALSTAS
jgi:hypothetical protein